MADRKRMILDLPKIIQMAIKIRAVKRKTTTGAVVQEAIETIFPNDIADAKLAIAERTNDQDQI